MVPSVEAVEVGMGVAITIVMAADVASPVAEVVVVEEVVAGEGLGVEVPTSDEETAKDEAVEVLVEDASTVVVATTVPSKV